MFSISLKHHKYILAFIISLVVIVLITLIFGSLYDTSDDLGNKCSIQGIVFFNEPETNLHYVKSLLASCILVIPDTFYLGFAKYDVFHFLLYVIILTYFVSTIIIQQQQSLIRNAILFFLLILIFTPLIIRPQYTNTAGLLAMILVLLIIRNTNPRNFTYFIVGFILVFIGYGLRKEMFLTIIFIFTPILFINFDNIKQSFNLNLKSLPLILLIFFGSIGVLEIYERFVGTPTEIESRKNKMHLNFSKIFDYGYTSKFRKPSNQDVFKSSGLSENDLDLVSNRFYWNEIDTLLPKIKRAINEITARQSKMSRLLTVKFSFKYLLTKELLVYTFSLLLLIILAAVNLQFKQFLPYLFSTLLFLAVVFTYGWIQRYSYTRLFYAPLVSLIVVLIYQTRNFKGSSLIQGVLLVLFLSNTVSALQVHKNRIIDAKEMSIKVHRGYLTQDSLVAFGGKINFEYLYPPVPLKGCPPPPQLLITNPISAVARLNKGTNEVFLSDSLYLNRLDIFSHEHFNKKLNYRLINRELGIYAVSMDSLSYSN